jgi:endo-1,4-beta-xylanase
MHSATLASTSAPTPRVSETVVTVVDASGAPTPSTEVVVTQSSHAFGFGNIGFDFIGLANGQPDEIFNAATLPFCWGRFEPKRGMPDTARLQQAARWFRRRGVTLTGHSAPVRTPADLL